MGAAQLQAFAFFVLIVSSYQAPVAGPKLLLISFDGFRWDYLTKTDTPNFDKVINSGVKAKWIKDTFTSLTFPNHYTIVTGLYEESHGIISNKFYDPVYGETFSINNRTTVEDGKFWGGEPIWVTNQLQRGQSGVYYWVGSEAEIKGIRPTEYKEYEKEDTTMDVWRKRVDSVIKWIINDSMNLALLYFREPDHVGHVFGPDSQEVVDMIKQCDEIIGYLIDELEKKNLYDDLNIIITSDHGMTAMNESRFITLVEHIDTSQVENLINYVDGAGIWPKDGKGITEDLYHNLSIINEHVPVWMKDDIPSQYHYSNNRRVAPILMAPENGWGIKVNWTDGKFLLGRHGFNNSEMDMHPFFLARGPSFKEGYLSEPFENIHIYELMCHILRLEPAPNNGSLSAVLQLLVEKSSLETIENYFRPRWIAIYLSVIVAMIFVVLILKELCKMPRRRVYRRMSLLDEGSENDENTDDQQLLMSSLQT